MNTCDKCIHWKKFAYQTGDCTKIREKIDIELVTGWDGGYVKAIETEADFGCNQFEDLE